MRRHLVHLTDHFRQAAEQYSEELSIVQLGTGQPSPVHLSPVQPSPRRASTRPSRPVPDPAQAEARACRDIRKHIAWYLKGYPVGQNIRSGLATVKSLAEFDQLVSQLDGDQPYPGVVAEAQRGRGGSQQQVSLPEGWLNSRELAGGDARLVREAELAVSGG